MLWSSKIPFNNNILEIKSSTKSKEKLEVKMPTKVQARRHVHSLNVVGIECWMAIATTASQNNLNSATTARPYINTF